MVVCLFAFGCSSANHQRLLQKTVHAYHQQLRWRLLDEALTYVSFSFRDRWEKAHVGADSNLRIVSVERRAVKSDEVSENAARFIVKVTWYIEGQMRVRESEWVEDWSLRSGNWQLTEEKRLDGASPSNWP